MKSNIFLDKLKNSFGETSTYLIKTFFIYIFIALSIILIKVLIARLYGQAELGIFTYFFSLVSLLFLFVSLGMPESIAQIIIKEPKKLNGVLKKYLPLVLLSVFLITPLVIFILNQIGLNPNLPYFNWIIFIYIVSYVIQN